VLSPEDLLRNHHTTPDPGKPDAAAPEPVHAHPELAIVVDAHARDAELVVLLEQEERGVAVRTQPVAVVAGEALDLRLCQHEFVERATEVIEDAVEIGIPNHLVNFNERLLRRLARDVEAPVLEIGVHVAGEDVLRLRQSLLAIRLTNLDGLTRRDKGEDTGLRHCWLFLPRPRELREVSVEGVARFAVLVEAVGNIEDDAVPTVWHVCNCPRKRTEHVLGHGLFSERSIARGLTQGVFRHSF